MVVVASDLGASNSGLRAPILAWPGHGIHNLGLEAPNLGLKAPNPGLEAPNLGLRASYPSLGASNSGLRAFNLVLEVPHSLVGG